jgi:hypothetical protein
VSKYTKRVAEQWKRRLMNPPKPKDKYAPDELVLRPERRRYPPKKKPNV